MVCVARKGTIKGLKRRKFHSPALYLRVSPLPQLDWGASEAPVARSQLLVKTHRGRSPKHYPLPASLGVSQPGRSDAFCWAFQTHQPQKSKPSSQWVSSQTTFSASVPGPYRPCLCPAPASLLSLPPAPNQLEVVEVGLEGGGRRGVVEEGERLKV